MRPLYLSGPQTGWYGTLLPAEDDATNSVKALKDGGYRTLSRVDLTMLTTPMLLYTVHTIS